MIEFFKTASLNVKPTAWLEEELVRVQSEIDRITAQTKNIGPGFLKKYFPNLEKLKKRKTEIEAILSKRKN